MPKVVITVDGTKMSEADRIARQLDADLAKLEKTAAMKAYRAALKDLGDKTGDLAAKQKTATDAARALAAANDKLAQATSRTAGATREAAKEQTSFAGQTVVVANAAIQMAQTMARAAQATLDFVAAGAQANALAENFTGDLQGLRAATANTIDDTSLQQLHTLGTQFGLTQSQIEGVGRAATKLRAEGFGTSAAENFTAIMNGQAEALRKLGITVDTTSDAYRGLSEEGKKVAIAQQVAMRGAMVTNGQLKSQVTEIDKTRASWTNLVSTVQQGSADMYFAIQDGIVDGLWGIRSGMEAVTGSGKSFADFAAREGRLLEAQINGAESERKRADAERKKAEEFNKLATKAMSQARAGANAAAAAQQKLDTAIPPTKRLREEVALTQAQYADFERQIRSLLDPLREVHMMRSQSLLGGLSAGMGGAAAGAGAGAMGPIRQGSLEETQALSTPMSELTAQSEALHAAMSPLAEVAAFMGEEFGALGPVIGALGESIVNLAEGFAASADASSMFGTAIAAGKMIAGAAIKDKKQLAWVNAGFEGAEAAAAYATGNIPGGIAHTVAAGLYVGVATGAVGSSAGRGASQASRNVGMQSTVNQAPAAIAAARRGPETSYNAIVYTLDGSATLASIERERARGTGRKIDVRSVGSTQGRMEF